MSHGGWYQNLLTMEKGILWTFIALLLIFFGLQVWVLSSGATISDPGDALSRISRAIHDAWFYRLGTVFIILDILLFAFLIFALIKAWPWRLAPSMFEKPSHGAHHAGPHAARILVRRDPHLVQQWMNVLARAKTGTPENMRLAILEADAIVDRALKLAGYQGDHMADRLGQVNAEKFLSLPRVWTAHRLRNELVHMPGSKVSVDETKEALTAYRDFLIEAGMIG